MCTVKVEIPFDVPKKMKSLTLETIEVVKKALAEKLAFFEADDSPEAYKTIEELKNIVCFLGGYLVKENLDYDLINWQSRDPESGKYFVIFES